MTQHEARWLGAKIAAAVSVMLSGGVAVAAPITLQPGDRAVFNFDASSLPAFDYVELYSGFRGSVSSMGAKSIWMGLHGTDHFRTCSYFISNCRLQDFGNGAPEFVDGQFSLTIESWLGTFTVDPYAVVYAWTTNNYQATVVPIQIADTNVIPEPAVIGLTLLGLAAAYASTLRRREKR